MREATAAAVRLDGPYASRYARKRPWRQFVVFVVLAVLVAGSFWAVEWNFASLTDPDRRAIAFERMGGWLSGFLTPNLSADFLAVCWALTLQTLSAAALGTGLAVVFAYLLALGSSRTVMVGERGGTRRYWRSLDFDTWQAALRSCLRVVSDSMRRLVCSACRLIQDTLRAVPDFVWAVILVGAIGLGPMTGALALALNVTGILAKVYSELWDSVPEREYEHVRSLGAGRLGVFLYGIRPLAARSVQSFTLMRAECAIRNAAVIGAVGGGGLGSEITYQISQNSWSSVSTLIFFTLALTLTADLASNFIRRQLRNDPNHPRAVKSRSLVRSLSRGYLGAGFVVLVVAWSVWFMGFGNNTRPGEQPVNHLEPVGEIFSGEAWHKLAFFKDLLHPRLDGEALGVGDAEEIAKREAAGRTVNLFAVYGPLEFYMSEARQHWDRELSKWFGWRVIRSSFVVLAMALVGTLIGVVIAIMLTYPHSIAFQVESRQFTGEAAPWWVRATRWLQLVLARLLGLFARGVPELIWAFLLIAFFGAGVVAGTAALAIHTAGVLVRVFSETVDNIPYRRFEQGFMGSRMACFGYAAVPTSWRTWMTYAFFQFESNVRMAIVLGIVGIAGLGFFFKYHFEFFMYREASAYLMMMIVLTVIIDRLSRWLNLSRVAR